MIDFLIIGGPIFTFPMTLLFLVNIALAVRAFIFINNDRFASAHAASKAVDTVKYVGVVLLTLGILGQIIGLYGAFQAIEAMDVDINPAMLAGGIKVSSVTTLLGLTYFILSYVGWLALRARVPANG